MEFSLPVRRRLLYYSSQRKGDTVRYIISYDLNKPEKDYETLWKTLRDLGAQRVLKSQWVVRRTGTDALTLAKLVWDVMTENDLLLVTCLDSPDWAASQRILD